MDGWDWFVVIGYVAMAIAYGWSMYYSITRNDSARGHEAWPDTAQRVIAIIISAIAGLLWPIALPVFAFAIMFIAARGRR